jgi:hypothetical protein
VRSELDAWYAEFPDADRDLRNRFIEPDKRQHLAAWWELYTFTLFRRLGYSIDVHPRVSGTTGRPDFLVDNGSTSMYVECAAMFGDEVENPDGQAWICQCINQASNDHQASNPDFMVEVDIEQVGTERPRCRDITNPLDAWLSTLDAGTVAADFAARQLHQFRLPVRDWVIVFTALAIPDRSGGRRRMIAVYPSDPTWIKDSFQIRKILSKKGSKYGTQPDRPIVVALVCWNSVDEDDLTNALFGTVAVRYVQPDPKTVQSVRIRDGYWRPVTDQRGARISAVLFGNTLRVWRAASKLPELWINPWASKLIPQIPPFATRSADSEGNFTSTPATSTAANVFGLATEWPNAD